MDLTINEDGTYCLKYQYQDKEERLVEEKGTYSILDDILVVTVTPSSGEKLIINTYMETLCCQIA